MVSRVGEIFPILKKTVSTKDSCIEQAYQWESFGFLRTTLINEHRFCRTRKCCIMIHRMYLAGFACWGKPWVALTLITPPCFMRVRRRYQEHKIDILILCDPVLYSLH